MSNFDPLNRLLELIQESKSLMRMGIQLPESAIDVLKQVGVGLKLIELKCLYHSTLFSKVFRMVCCSPLHLRGD